MTKSEKDWWKAHGQEIVDTMAADDGPDVVGLLHDKTSYGVYGDHGGAQETVQRVPMVFWSPGLAYGARTGRVVPHAGRDADHPRGDGHPAHHAGGRHGPAARELEGLPRPHDRATSGGTSPGRSLLRPAARPG